MLVIIKQKEIVPILIHKINISTNTKYFIQALDKNDTK